MATSLNHTDSAQENVSDSEQVDGGIDLNSSETEDTETQAQCTACMRRGVQDTEEQNEYRLCQSRNGHLNCAPSTSNGYTGNNAPLLTNGIDQSDEDESVMQGILASAENSNVMNDFIDIDFDITEMNSDFNTSFDGNDNIQSPSSDIVVNGNATINGQNIFLGSSRHDEDDLDHLNHREDKDGQNNISNERRCNCLSNSHEVFDQEVIRCYCGLQYDPLEGTNCMERDSDNEEVLEGAVGYHHHGDDSIHKNSNGDVDADDEREHEEPSEEDKLAAEIINFGLMFFRGPDHRVKDMLKKVARSRFAHMIDFNRLIEDIQLYQQRYRARELRARERTTNGNSTDDGDDEKEKEEEEVEEKEKPDIGECEAVNSSSEIDDEEDCNNDVDDEFGCQDESNNAAMRRNYKRPDDHNNFDYLSMISRYDDPFNFDSDSEGGDEDESEVVAITPMKADDATVFLWTFEEAVARQVRQVGASACGATAVINVLNCLYMTYDVKTVINAIPTRLRLNHAPLPEYLFSRSVAGTTHEDLITGMEGLTEGRIYGRFFSFYPKRDVDLKEWLAYWMKKGAVPLATLNLQRGQEPGWKIPDAWHHQMIHGLGSDGIYMTNPLVTESVQRISQQLSSDSELLIRKYDVLGRWNEETDLTPLMTHADKRWSEMNVLGQVVNMIRERSPQSMDYPVFGQQSYRLMTTHIKIPAAYKSGITLFVQKSKSDVYEELQQAPELPIIERMQEMRNMCVVARPVVKLLSYRRI